MTSNLDRYIEGRTGMSGSPDSNRRRGAGRNRPLRLTGADKIGGMSEPYGPPDRHGSMPEGQEAHEDASSPDYPPGAYGEGCAWPSAKGYAPEGEDPYAPRGAHAADRTAAERPGPYVPPPRAAYGEGSPEPHPMPGPPAPPPLRADRVQAERVVPRWLARLPYAFVLCSVAAGLAVVATNHFRRGSMLIAAAVFIGALARLLLPESQVGMLAVRRRWLDVLLMTTAAVGITLVAFVAKGTTG